MSEPRHPRRRLSDVKPENIDEDEKLAEAWHLYVAAKDVADESREAYLAAQRNWLERRNL